ncbi:NlpC/P60 family protein [Blastochloris tepida]|uniref:Peptidase P60 n=1 Tax=Blastochloris tepida TaxID=2233851 RepID=A0A348G5M1_9HYPH|nr:NlpC/P60 family protein [Blastochloris tepida]BBF94854.1 peptidase P60 [Blastochloris tepida]
MTGYDPRITPARPDLAALHLEGKVPAARYVAGTVCEVAVPAAPMRREPIPDQPMVTEALFGERATIYEATPEGWAWGQLEVDGYVGWLPSAMLAPPGPEPTHCVRVPRTFIFPGPDIKLPPLTAPPLGARIAIAGTEGRFAVTAAGGYIPAHHVRPIAGPVERDFVTVAERLLGVPYLWGGKTPLGFDCSGLVQVALDAAGIRAPRDSDLQEAALGRPVDPGVDFANVQRGDLVFWRGHVAIVSDPQTLVHANAFHMMVAIEPLAQALARIVKSGLVVTSVCRLPSLGG